MRGHLFFISTIVAMTGSIIYFSATLRERSLLYIHREKQDARDFLAKFRDSHRPIAEVNLAAMYGRSGQFQILHPIFEMKSLRPRLSASTCASGGPETSPGFGHEVQCEYPDAVPAPGFGVEGAIEAKRRDYFRILRGETAPPDFILNPPFVDEYGHSYAQLLSQKDISPYNSAEWVRDHLSFFKTTELRDILIRHRISDPAFETVSRLTESEIRSMVEGDPIVITADYLLMRNESRLGFSPLSYWAYGVRDVYQQLRGQDHDLMPYSPELHCLQRIGNACWIYSSRTALAYVYKYSVAVIVFAAIILTLLVALYVRHVADHSRVQQIHRTSLQVLSHEFRTPVSAILLLAEDLSKRLSTLGERDQDAVMKIAAEAFRLQRIIEMSKTYLESTSRTTRFKRVLIPSVNDWVEDFAADFDPRIKCELAARDQGIQADPFWLRVVLANLVQNAFIHGKEPVRIRVSERRGRIQISVEDEGVCDFTSLREMSEAFVKCNRSGGMGLGLNIATAIVNDWGGELRFRPSPTSFSIAFDQMSKE